MATRLSRLRLGYADGDLPNGFHPLLRVRIAAAGLLGALLAVLCLPVQRQLAFTYLSAALTDSPPPWFHGSAGPEVYGKRYLAVLARHPDDPGLHLAAALAGVFESDRGKPAPTDDAAQLDVIRGLRRRFPDDVALIAFQFRRMSQKNLLIPNRRDWSDRGEPAPARRIAPPTVLAECRRLAAEGSRLEPDNAFFPAMLAVAAFGAGQEAEGLAALHTAGEKTRWNEHVLMEAEQYERLLREAYGDHGFWIKGIAHTRILLPHYADLRVAARAAAWEAGRAANRRSEHTARLDVIRVAALMRRDVGIPIGKLVAHAMQLPALEALQATGPRRSPRLQDARERELMAAYLDRVRKEAPGLMPEVAKEIEAAQRFRIATRERELGDSWTPLFSSSSRRDTLGVTLVANLVCTFAFALLAAAAVTALGGPKGAAVAIGRIAGAITLSGLLLVAAFLFFAREVKLLDWFRWLQGHPEEGLGHFQIGALLLHQGVMTPLLVTAGCFVGVLVTRARWREAVGGLAMASSFIALVLTAAEVAFLLYAAPAQIRDTRALAQVIRQGQSWPGSVGR